MAKDMSQIEAETIGALLHRPDNIALALELGCRADWFTVDKWSLVWSVAESFWRRGAPLEIGRVNIVEEARRLSAQDGERRDASALTVANLADAIDAAPVDPSDHLRLLRNDSIERAPDAARTATFKESKSKPQNSSHLDKSRMP